MILDHSFPPDIRVENEALSLTQEGHEVHILCFDYEGKLPKLEKYNGIFLHRIYKSKKWVNRGRGLINTILNYYPKFLEKKIYKFIQESAVEILHVHDLYLLGAAISIKEKHNIPIIADLHENYVAALGTYIFANTFPGNILISKSKWAKKEIEWCQKVDRIITVIEEAADRYHKLGIPKDKITVVANYVNKDQFLSSNDNTEIIDRFKNIFAVTYIGGFDLHRGIESVIKAVPTIVKNIPDFKLVLVGKGRNYKDLENLVIKNQIENYVLFEGFQPQHTVPTYIKISSICLIPHLKTEHTDNTIPHKLFQYMLMGKPVLASDCNPLKRIIEDSGTGLIHISGNSEDIAKQINYLYHNPDLMEMMGRKGPKAIEEHYNWDATAENLKELYNVLGK